MLFLTLTHLSKPTNSKTAIKLVLQPISGINVRFHPPHTSFITFIFPKIKQVWFRLLQPSSIGDLHLSNGYPENYALKHFEFKDWNEF